MLKKIALLTSMLAVLGMGTAALSRPNCEECIQLHLRKGETCSYAIWFCTPYYGAWECPTDCDPYQ